MMGYEKKQFGDWNLQFQPSLWPEPPPTPVQLFKKDLYMYVSY